MKKLHLNTLALLLTLGGCSQIIGISDYDIDTKLDDNKTSAGESNAGGDGGGGKTGTGGAGGNSTPQGGEGGDQPTAGSSGAPDPGGDAGATSGGAGGEGGGNNPPRVVLDCSDESCCTQSGGVAEGIELLVTAAAPQTYYGDFELTPPPWSEGSASGMTIVVDKSAGASPHKGDYFAWLVGFKDEWSALESEPFEVPVDAGWLTLSGYRKFQIDSAIDDENNTDSLLIAISDDTSYLDYFYEWGPTDPGETGSWAAFKLSVPATAHQGTTRYLDFYGEADDYFTDETIDGSNYEFDDLSLKVFRCYEK